MLATDYDKLWTQVDKAMNNDLPKDAMSVLKKISNSAERDGNYGELLAAEMMHARIEAEVTPDSLSAVITRLKDDALAADKKDELLAAVYNALLAKICVLGKDYAEGEETLYWDKALSNTGLLANTKTDAYRRLTVEGDDAIIFNNDMLSLIGKEAGRLQMLKDYYDLHGNKRAACIVLYMMLSEVEYDDDRGISKVKKLISEGLETYGSEAESILLEYKSFLLYNEDIDATDEGRYSMLKSLIAKYDKRYGNGEKYVNVLRNHLSEITLPVLVLSVTDSITLNVRNTDEVRLTFTRLNANGRNSFNTAEKNWWQKAMKKATSPSCEIVRKYDNPEWESHEEKIALPDLPYGVYLVKATNGNQNNYAIYYHTHLRLLTLPCGDKKECRIVVVDKKSGAPVGKATVVISQVDNKGKELNSMTLNTDNNGETMFKGNFEPNTVWAYTNNGANNSKDSDDAMPQGRMYNGFEVYQHIERRNTIKVFTDRTVYRPGQTLKASIIVFNASNQDSIHCVANHKVHVSLRNAEYNVIYATDVITDEMGNAGLEYLLPKDCKNGVFSLSCSADKSDTNSAQISVEEYKRPTFELNVINKAGYDDVRHIVKEANDTTINIGIMASTYSGVPVQNAKVKYSVTRRQQWFWWRSNTMQRNVVSNATTKTDKDGKAWIEFEAMLPENDYSTYIFTVTATVTDASGETHDVVQEVSVKRNGNDTTAEAKEPQEPKKEFEVSADNFPRNGAVTFTMRNNTAGKTYAYYTIFAGKKILENGKVEFHDEYTRELTYKKEYGEGISLYYIYVMDGKEHAYSTTIKKPLPDTTLPVRWSTFRDRTQPGSMETWTLKVGNDKVKVKAALTATIYDKSLDALRLMKWNFNVPVPTYYTWSRWSMLGYSHTNIRISAETKWLEEKDDFLLTRFNSGMIPYRSFYNRYGGGIQRRGALLAVKSSIPLMESVGLPQAKMSKATIDTADAIDANNGSQNTKDDEVAENISAFVRTDLGETAFFTPSLLTDSKGNITLSFRLPETMTSWRLQGMVHDSSMHYAMLDEVCEAKKDIIVKPNVPRFLRQNDKTSFAATISNTTTSSKSAVVTMQLLTPGTENVIWQKKQSINIDAEGSTDITFDAPQMTADTLLIYRIAVQADGASDGEQHYIPVIPATELVTTSVAFTLHNQDVLTKDISGLYYKDSKHRDIKTTYSANAAKMISDAIPAVTHPDNKDALSLASATYVSSLFNLNDSLRQKLTEELSELQLGDGRWAWWKGMEGSTWITSSIVRMLARLEMQGHGNGMTLSMLHKALPKLTEFIEKEAADLQKMQKEYPKQKFHPSETTTEILYSMALMRNADNKRTSAILDDHKKTVNYLIKLVENAGPEMTIYGKANAAVLLAYYGKTKSAAKHLESMKQYSVCTEEAGRYYDSPRAYYSWRNYKIPTQVAAIEALRILDPSDTITVMEMKRWLLHEKRTQQWDNSVNTADAVYAFLLGEKTDVGEVPSTDGITVADDGKTVTLTKTNTGTSWGAVYVTQRAPLSSIEAMGSGFTVKRELIDNGSITRVGDRVTVRITIVADRDYDLVEVCDNRAACLEPVQQISGYCIAETGGTARDSYSGYYRMSRDNRTEYFFDHMAKGTHVIETEYYIDRMGTYNEGTCTVKCAYAPEFRAIGTPDAITTQKNEE